VLNVVKLCRWCGDRVNWSIVSPPIQRRLLCGSSVHMFYEFGITLTLILTISSVYFDSHFQPCVPPQQLSVEEGTCRAADEIADTGVPVLPNLSTPSLQTPLSSPLAPTFWARDYGLFFPSVLPRRAAVGLWLEGPLQTRALPHGVWMLKRRPPSSLTVPAPPLDAVSSPGTAEA